MPVAPKPQVTPDQTTAPAPPIEKNVVESPPGLPEVTAPVEDAAPTRTTAPEEEASLAEGENEGSTNHDVEVGDVAMAATKPRRHLKIVTAVGAIVVLAGAGGAGMVLSRGSTDARAGSPVLTIRIPDRPVRQRTADGQEVITTTAEVVNGGTAPGRVPELKATMRTPDGRVVREWRVTPPEGDIAPKNSRSVQIGTTGTQVPQGPLTLDVDMIERDER